MCWNEHVSLNTFVFSAFVLGLVMYNNAYTPYKVPELNNRWMVIFVLSFMLMQLIEVFIWRNIDNPLFNRVFSTVASLLLIAQPVASLMLIRDDAVLRRTLVALYLLLAVPVVSYQLATGPMTTSVGADGHLRWNFLTQGPWTSMFVFVWLCFFLFSFVHLGNWQAAAFGIVTLVITYINYSRHSTMWSMWCWSVNSVFVYYAFYLLIGLPYKQDGGLMCA